MFYFSKRVPSDLKDLYKVERLTYSLKTKCPETAEKLKCEKSKNELRKKSTHILVVDADLGRTLYYTSENAKPFPADCKVTNNQ